MDTQNRRKEYFIDKDFQRNFILKFCGLVVLASVISGAALYLFSRNTVTTAFVNSRLSIVSTSDYILPSLIGSGLIAIALVGIATTIVVMYISHRISGPIFNIERSIKQVGKGDLTTKISLRSTDEMGKLADCVNEMTENLKNNIFEIKTKSDDLEKAIEKMASSKLAQEESEKLSKKKEELNRAVDYFKI